MLNGMGGVNQHNQMRNKPAQNSPRGKKPGGGKKKSGGAFGMGSIENQLMDIIKMQGKLFERACMVTMRLFLKSKFSNSIR